MWHSKLWIVWKRISLFTWCESSNIDLLTYLIAPEFDMLKTEPKVHLSTNISSTKFQKQRWALLFREALKSLEAAIRGTPEFIKPHQRYLFSVYQYWVSLFSIPHLEISTQNSALSKVSNHQEVGEDSRWSHWPLDICLDIWQTISIYQYISIFWTQTVSLWLSRTSDLGLLKNNSLPPHYRPVSCPCLSLSNKLFGFWSRQQHFSGCFTSLSILNVFLHWLKISFCVLYIAFINVVDVQFNVKYSRRAVPRKIPRLEDIADTEYLDFPEVL